MRLTKAFLDTLAMDESAKLTVSKPMLQMPLLISERALADAATLLAAHSAALADAGYTPRMEVIAMPKHGYGPRPVGVLAPAARTLYQAIVARLEPCLPEPSRLMGIDRHHAFGLEAQRSESDRIVDLDIAACYEYIDHTLLADELVLQGLDSEGVGALLALLVDLFPRAVGIPQALDASHLLADLYLNRMQRALLRNGYDVSRFADDFRIISPNWAAAHQAIEIAVEQARAIGLTLSDGKTTVRSAAQLRAIDEERESMFAGYTQRAADGLRSIELVQTDYDDWEFQEVEASDEDVDFETRKAIVSDWVKSDREGRSNHSYFGAQALRDLRAAPERLKDEWLLEIATREPIRLRAVLSYVLGRGEPEKNWGTILGLTQAERLGPWSRLWLLWAVEQLPTMDVANSREVLSWVEQCLDDKFESVRAEAAWVLARARRIDHERLARLYLEASHVTELGIAAAVGRLDGGKSSKVGGALRSQSALAVLTSTVVDSVDRGLASDAEVGSV